MPAQTEIPRQPVQKEPVGPLIGIGIIVILALFGALYFWAAVVNGRINSSDQLPLITGNDTSTTTFSTTTITVVK